MRRLIFSAVILYGAALLPAAQHSGTVRAADQPVPGATVVATTGDKKLTTTTGDDGSYTFRDLPSGVWLIEVEMFGFARQGQPLLVSADATSFEWSLELKSRVAKAAPAPAPQPAVISSATKPAATPALPVPAAALPKPTAHAGTQNGFVTLALNAETEEAAAAPAPPPPSDDAGPSEAFLVTGSMSRGLDDARKEEDRGTSRGESRRSSGLSLGSDSVGDFGGIGPTPTKGMSSGIPMSSGRSRGSSSSGYSGKHRHSSKNSKTSIGNKRQQNDIRGSVYTSLRNSELDAKAYSLSGQPTPKPSYAMARMGVSAGGGLRIPKIFEPEGTFFYFTYTGSHARSPYNTTTTLPSAMERAGDFSQSVARAPIVIYDPSSQLPFAGNRIPQNRINPAALGLLSFIPSPTYAGRVQNYQYITSIPNVSDNYGIRLNQTLSRHDRLDFNVNIQTRDSESSTVYGFRDSGTGNGLSSSAGYTHNFGPKFTNSVHWNFSRNLTKNTPYFAYGPDVARQLGINGTSTDPRNFGPPNLSFTNFGGLSDTTPLVSRSQTSTVSDGIVIVKKKHNLSLGGDFRRMQRNTYSENGRGGFSFSGLATSAFDANGQPMAGTGFDFADFLLGLPQSSSIRFGAANTYFRAQEYNAYASDDFRLKPNFTIVAGLRYEYFTPYTEKFGHIANLDIAPGFTGVAVVTPGQTGPYTGEFPDSLVNSNKRLLSPRAGFGWKPSKKRAMVIRAGYGLFFVGSVYNQFPSRLASQPPFATTASITTSTTHPLTLQDGFAAAPNQNVTNTYAVDKGYRVPYVQNWNFSIQQTLKHGFFVQGAYMGNKGTRLDLQLMPNRAAPGSPLTAEQRRMIGNATGFTFDTSVGNSIYHAANLQLQRRFQKGVSFTANYTLSKAIDNASSFGGGIVQDAYNLRAERGLSSFDQRHVLNMGWYLLSPVGEHGLLKNGNWSKRLMGGWSLSGSVTYASGTPYTARVLGNLSNTGGNVGSGRADATGLDITGGTGFFNPLAFTIPPSGRFGDAGRDTIPGLPRESLNVGFGRSFSLSGDNRRRIEFRMDATNITNHVNYTSVGTVVNASNYGLPLATAGMRSLNGTLRFRF